MRFVPETLDVADLIRDLDEGALALPEFQRHFIWKPPAIADLLRTVARRWPAGTFLLLAVEGEPEFAFKELSGAPKPTAPKTLLLDGQQRTTAVYQAFSDKAPETYFVQIAKVVEAGEFEDEHLEYLKTSKYVQRYGSPKAEAEAGVIKVSTLTSDADFQKWLRYIDGEAEQDALVEARAELLPGFKSYDFPAVRLPSEVPLPAIAKIFETLNRTGVRLATFDLMVARLYPYDFKLRDVWKTARENHNEFEEFGIEDDADHDDRGVEILKVIALKQHLLERDAGIKITIKGVRESDVLQLAPPVVIAGWDEAVDAYVRAMRFVRDHCGVIRKGLLPQATMLLPIADILASSQAQRPGFESDLARWFWATSFSQTYSQGANTRAVADARSLRAWLVDAQAVPSVVASFRLDSELLLDGRRRNEMLLRGLMCQLVLQGARDWVENKPFLQLADKVEVHHVFPDEYLEKHYQGDKDPVANFALLTESTNKKLRNTLPKDVLVRPDVKLSAIESQVVDAALFEPSTNESPAVHIERFVTERAKKLEGLVYEAVGAERPPDPT